MGHERIGVLPKSQQWRDVVQLIASLQMSEIEVSDIVIKTIQNVRSRFRYICRDEGVIAAFKFLIALSVASRSLHPRENLSVLGIDVPENPSLLSLAKSVHLWVSLKQESLEYSQIAQSATVDAIVDWYNQNKTGQGLLFESMDTGFEVWRKAGTGAGFCELARLFFAKFTERYLNYFLEREASAYLWSINEREEFGEQLEEYVDEISQYAFETAKITQSFAAGWFNKHASEGIPPNDEDIESFLWLAFGKIREELSADRARTSGLLREGEEK